MSAPANGAADDSLALRVLIVAHSLLALALLRDPEALLARLGGAAPDADVRTFARILGARHLLEAVGLVCYHGRRSMYAAAAVDATHAGTMLLLARRSARHRRLAQANAAAAFALCLDAVRCGRHADP